MPASVVVRAAADERRRAPHRENGGIDSVSQWDRSTRTGPPSSRARSIAADIEDGRRFGSA